MALLLTVDTDVQFVMSEVDVVAVQQFPFPAGRQEDEAGGQTGEEGCPGQEVAVAVEESVSLPHLQHLPHRPLHQLDDGQHRDGSQQVQHWGQPPGTLYIIYFIYYIEIMNISWIVTVIIIL